jgi:hypothetical protein
MIAVVIPDRNDRPKMLSNCLRMMHNQTFQPVIHLMNQKPLDEKPDITRRYRIGYEEVSNMELAEFELIFFIETDDWYHPNYLEFMLYEWRKNGKPDIFGIDYTYYYHLKLRKYFKYGHEKRASMMNTCIKPGLIFKWPVDNYRFCDMYLWLNMNGKTISPSTILSIGMKGHNEGMTGGTGHHDKLFRYVEEDNGFLENNLDKESFEFFNQYRLKEVNLNV